jgi:nitrogen fixation/metabolism regulation signal transduction histidine kinase
MVTNEAMTQSELLDALQSPDWTVVLQAVGVAELRLRGAIVGDPEAEEIVSKLTPLANHSKWEVRRAVANSAAQAAHPVFENVLAKLAIDDNSRVRQAADHAALRRRDSRHASTLGKQHEERINTTLDDIEARFGLRGHTAVRRAADEIANTFARELYHEVIKLLSPLATSAERLRTQLSAPEMSTQLLSEEADRIDRRVAQLRAVLDAMRAYTAQPALTFTSEIVREVVEEAVSLALESGTPKSRRPPIEINVPSTLVAEMSRVRVVQALTNVLLNAIESYREGDSPLPIVIKGDPQGTLAVVTVVDSGCGMSAEAQGDALKLFATSKPTGTGFGLPLAVKIIESEHGGRLSIDSAKGRGTSVRIVIPIHRHSERI